MEALYVYTNPLKISFNSIILLLFNNSLSNISSNNLNNYGVPSSKPKPVETTHIYLIVNSCILLIIYYSNNGNISCTLSLVNPNIYDKRVKSLGVATPFSSLYTIVSLNTSKN